MVGKSCLQSWAADADCFFAMDLILQAGLVSCNEIGTAKVLHVDSLEEKLFGDLVQLYK